MTSPKVSINLCCYNSEINLRETLDSIVNQTYKDWELIIINDGSSDSTESIIYEYLNQGFQITYYYQENKGLGYSRNKAMKRSQGEYIAFIDHDDIWMTEKLAKQVPLFQDPEVGLVFCDTVYFNDRGDEERLYSRRKYATGSCFEALLIDYFLAMPSVVIRSSVLADMEEWFDPRFYMNEEADLFIRIAHKWKLAMVDAPLAKWRMHPASLTWTRYSKFADEFEEMLVKYHQLYPDFASRYAKEIRALKRHIALIRAKWFLETGDLSSMRSQLSPHIFLSMRALILFLISCFPKRFIKLILRKFGAIRVELSTED